MKQSPIFNPKNPSASFLRILLALVVALLVYALCKYVIHTPEPAVYALVSGVFVFVLAGWVQLWPFTGEQTRDLAKREDYPRGVDEMLVLLVSLLSIAGVVWLQIEGQGTTLLSALVLLAGVYLCWASIHLMYAVRYAEEYYKDYDSQNPHPPIDFNSPELASYKDFFYFSYNLGMTYQVSDTSVSTTSLRAIILRHCLISFVFVAVLLGTVVNLVMNLI